jgi:hypothetical protein
MILELRSDLPENPASRLTGLEQTARIARNHMYMYVYWPLAYKFDYKPTQIASTKWLQ